jgi:hypothetical protein
MKFTLFINEPYELDIDEGTSFLYINDINACDEYINYFINHPEYKLVFGDDLFYDEKIIKEYYETDGFCLGDINWSYLEYLENSTKKIIVFDFENKKIYL